MACVQMAVRLHKIILVIVCTLQLWASILSNHWVHASVDKIFINTTTQLYTGSTDGRVYLFHGLATEDSSSPWTLSAYNDEQIELMKAVRVAIHSFVDLFQVTRMLPMCCK